MNLLDRAIIVQRRLSRWYLIWADDLSVICSFDNQFHAYQARRAILRE
jgi:hypothetical protein